MNLKKAKRHILLEQSGELSNRQRRQLERFLEGSEEGRQYRNELEGITRLARLEDAPALSDFATNRILDEARRTVKTAPARVSAGAADVAFRWKPAMVYASLALLLTLTAALLWRTPDRQVTTERDATEAPIELVWEDSLDEEIAELASMLAYEETDYLNENTDLDDLARQLLELEESQI